ncbi:MAG: chromosomal replication initiator protein DnaA [Candidatus Latescibacterota bacterium]|nr:MAG: chromosomal replication initiator protein DnaA [Candidatus Latescibacterota bacterium]
MDPAEAWALCLDFIRRQVPSQTFETWFRPTRCFRFDQSGIVIGVPHSFFAEWLEEHHIGLIRKAISKILPSVPEISFQVLQEDLPQPSPLKSSPIRTAERAEVIEVSLNLNPRYTFDTFVVGNSNQFAHAAARAVAEAPGATAFNPLVIYGGVGLGKTHILQAIAHYCVSVNNVRRIIYVTSEKFFLDFINAIQHGRSAEFSQIYRGADLLLVDDIQFLVNKETTQEEFFHTFNALHQNGKQIVLTSDCPPSELKGLEQRLISRFQWGLVADIQPPDLETRIAILKKKAERDGFELPEDVTLFIEEHITTNIRDLEGALIRLLAASSLTGQDITLDLARELLKDTIPTYGPGNITIESIQKKVCSHYQIPFDLLIGETRKKEVATARQVAMYIAKVLTNSSLKTIGLHFGGRDHSTVIHACQTVESRMQGDALFREEVQRLIDLCRRGR